VNEYKLLLKSITQPTADLLILELVNHDNSPVFSYKPGQYVMLSYVNEQGKKEEKHAFSIASSPTESGVIRLGIRKQGTFTQGLAKLKPGAPFVVYGPYGHFCFNETKHPDVVFFAGGIGITPFYSAMRYATDKGLSNNLSLVYSNRTLAGTAFYNEINNLASNNPRLRTLFSVTDETLPVAAPNLLNKKIDLFITKDFIGTTVGKTFFLCGPAPFMAGMKKNLLELGALEEQILMEEFSMISTQSFFLKIKYLSTVAGYGALALLLPLYLISAASGKSLFIKPTAATAVLNQAQDNTQPPLNKLPEADDKIPYNDLTDDDENNKIEFDQAATQPTAVADSVSNGLVEPIKYQAPVPVKPVQPTAIKNSVVKQPVAAPKPTTAASVVTKTTPAPITPTTPAPVTSASAPAGSATTPSTNNNPTVAPTPTTGASTAATGGTVSNPTTPTTNTGGSRRNREDDDD